MSKVCEAFKNDWFSVIKNFLLRNLKMDFQKKSKVYTNITLIYSNFYKKQLNNFLKENLYNL